MGTTAKRRVLILAGVLVSACVALLGAAPADDSGAGAEERRGSRRSPGEGQPGGWRLGCPLCRRKLMAASLWRAAPTKRGLAPRRGPSSPIAEWLRGLMPGVWLPGPAAPTQDQLLAEDTLLERMGRVPGHPPGPCERSPSLRTCGQADILIPLQGTLPARLETLALAAAVAELANRQPHGRCTSGTQSGAQPRHPGLRPLDGVACLLRGQSAPRVHVRALWGAGGPDGVGEWGDYFQPLRVLSDSGHVKLEVQAQTEEFSAPATFIEFKVPAAVVEATRRASNETRALEPPADEEWWREQREMRLIQLQVLAETAGQSLETVEQELRQQHVNGDILGSCRPGAEGLIRALHSISRRLASGENKKSEWCRRVEQALGVAADSALALLRPSDAVWGMMGLETPQDLRRLQGATAVYLEPFMPCQPGNIINCTVHHMATLMLRSRAQDFAVAAFWPTWAAPLHTAFHASAAPLLLRTSAARAWLCGGQGPPPPMRAPSPSERGREGHGEARRNESEGRQEDIMLLIAQWAEGRQRMQREGAAFWPAFHARGRDWHRALPQGPLWAQQARKSSSIPDSSVKEASLTMPGPLAGPHSSRLCTQLSVAELFLLGTARGLLRMSPTALQSRFILAQQQQQQQRRQKQASQHLKHPSSSSRLRDQGAQSSPDTTSTAGGPGKEPGRPVQKSESLAEAVCRREATLGAMRDGEFGSDGPRPSDTWESAQRVVTPLRSECVESGDCGLIGFLGLPSLTSSHWSRYMVADEDLGILYCSTYKVGSTKVQQWLKYAKSRHTSGLPWRENTGKGPVFPDTIPTGQAENQTLQYLDHVSDEAEAIRMATRRDLFRFAIVRNPFARAVSAYLDKHVRGGEQRSRAYWNQLFFGECLKSQVIQAGATGPGHEAEQTTVSRESEVLPFRAFLELLQCAHASPFEALENHINPQSNSCNLHGIEYDFIGHLESLEEDMARVMRHTRLPAESAAAAREFFRTKSSHATNAFAEGMKLYRDEASIDIIRRAYRCDMEVPLNGLSFSFPYNNTVVKA